MCTSKPVYCLRATALLALLALCAVRPGAVAAQEAARQMLDEAKRLNDTTRAWKDREQRLSLRIIDGRGGERRRDLVMKTHRGSGGEDKTITVFSSPAEVKGTAFLQFAHRDRDAEQWLLLPALGRTRQITSSAKGQSFVGTDFSYRDLELLTDVLEWTEEEATSRLRGREKLDDGVEVDLVELRPERKQVGYERIVVGLSRPDRVIRRLAFYEAGDEPKKILRLDAVETVGVVPTPRSLDMRQPAAGSRTIVEVSEVRYDQGLAEDLFTQRGLERASQDVE